MSASPAMARSPLRIRYLLATNEMSGGVKVILQQADLLAGRGHHVSIACPLPPPPWRQVEAEFVVTAAEELPSLPEVDVVVATYWTTIPAALESRCKQVVHFCQGFEGAFTHNRSEHPLIEELYRQPIPALVVSPHLGTLLAERFGRPSRWVPQPLESFWRPRPRLGPHRRPRVLVLSPFEIEWKGVETALRTVLELRRGGLEPVLVRISQWPSSGEELALLAPDEFHHLLTPREVARQMRRGDLLLAPSWEQEGFGLPVLEAMACGLPVVASRISSFESFASGAAILVPVGDVEAFADAARHALGGRRTWRALRRAGLAAAARFSEERTAAAAEEAFSWAVDGDWRRELAPSSPDRRTTVPV